MEDNVITLIVTIVTLVISALFSFGEIPLNIAIFYFLFINGVLFGSLGMVFEISKKESAPVIPFLGMIMFVALGFLCKTYIPALYFSDLVKQ